MHLLQIHGDPHTGPERMLVWPRLLRHLDCTSPPIRGVDRENILELPLQLEVAIWVFLSRNLDIYEYRTSNKVTSYTNMRPGFPDRLRDYRRADESS